MTRADGARTDVSPTRRTRSFTGAPPPHVPIALPPQAFLGTGRLAEILPLASIDIVSSRWCWNWRVISRLPDSAVECQFCIRRILDDHRQPVPRPARNHLRHPESARYRHRQAAGASRLQGAGHNQRRLCLHPRSGRRRGRLRGDDRALQGDGRPRPRCRFRPISKRARATARKAPPRPFSRPRPPGSPAARSRISPTIPPSPIYDFIHAVERVAAAVEAARSLKRDFVFTARAENLLRGINDLDDTIRRLQAFEKAGADVLYAPGIGDIETVRTICASVSKPVNVLAVSGFSVAELAEAGVKRISVGSKLTTTAFGAVRRAAQEMLGPGTFDYATGRHAVRRAADAVLQARHDRASRPLQADGHRHAYRRRAGAHRHRRLSARSRAARSSRSAPACATISTICASC